MAAQNTEQAKADTTDMPLPYLRPCGRCGKIHNCNRGKGEEWLPLCEECIKEESGLK